MNPNSIIGAHIFIIEDDVFMQYVLKRTFAGTSLVTMFGDGEAALTAMQNGVIPDLIITDLHTPVLNGMQLLSRMKTNAEFSHVPVLMMSADNSTEVRLNSLSAGANDYLVKPFEMKELVNRTNQVINTKHHLSLMHA